MAKNIIEGKTMRVRMHKGFGHGLAPNTDRDINCLSCRDEDSSELGNTPLARELAPMLSDLEKETDALRPEDFD